MLNTFQQQLHGMLPTPTSEEASRQEFAKSLKHFIQQGLLPGLHPIYSGRAAQRFEKEAGRAPVDRHDIRKAMVPDNYFRHYAAVNRISQELLWDSVIDSIEREEDSLKAAAAENSAKNKGELRIPEGFEVPRYVSSLDIHCMPGGYAGGPDDASDVSLGVLYDRGVYLYSMGYTGPFNDDMGRSVVNYLKRNMPDFKPRRILDLGCGDGVLSTELALSGARIHGVDASPELVIAARARGVRGPAIDRIIDANNLQVKANQAQKALDQALLDQAKDIKQIRAMQEKLLTLK
jgi:SAM-dependent methyltransferase